MNTIALMGLSPAACAVLSSIVVMIFLAVIAKRRKQEALTYYSVTEFVNECRQKRNALHEGETCEVLYFIRGDEHKRRRVWASARIFQNAYNIWLERSNLATDDDIEEMHRFQCVLIARYGYQVFMDVSVSEQPFEPKPKTEDAQSTA